MFCGGLSSTNAIRVVNPYDSRSHPPRRRAFPHIYMSIPSYRFCQEEKCTRAAQILENDVRIEEQRREKKADDERILAECKDKVKEEKQLQVRRADRRRYSLLYHGAV